VQKELKKKGIETYLPLLSKIRKYERKVKQVELPLISCYLFVKIRKPAYVPVLETEYVKSFVKFSKNLISIPEAEIELMQQVVGEKLVLSAEPYQWQEGDEVEVVAGSLTGLKGKLVSRDNKREFLVALTNMGYSLRLSVRPGLLRRVNL